MIVDTLIRSRWIIPVTPPELILENHSLAIRNGKIVELLPSDQALRKYQANRVEDLEHHALIPGLINSHTHSPMSLLRGIADDLPLMKWLKGTIWPLEQKWMSEAFVRAGAELAIAEMLRGGVTCFNDMYFFPEISARVALQSGIRACIGLIVIDFPSAWARDSNECLNKGLALYDELRNESLLSPVFAPHAPYSVSDDALEKIRMYSEELQIPIHMHVHETRAEIEQGLARTGMRPLARLKGLDLLGPSFIAVHMTQLIDEEIDWIAASDCHVVHCPESNLKLASGFCPVARLLRNGVNVALGTDSAASNNNLDVLGEMRTAALLAKGIAGDASAVPASTALRMATLGGAKALGIDSRCGSLEAGKSADITAITLDTLETLPVYDPISQIVYSANRDQVTDVWVAGRRLLESRTLTTLDPNKIKESIAHWSVKLHHC
ncbi:MAG: TRZ/ATZ family hydrolase [Methylococcaceae bacterium]|nr:TRZ/ATZ family hydrolase [Methylococcaceae bacterium]